MKEQTKVSNLNAILMSGFFWCLFRIYSSSASNAYYTYPLKLGQYLSYTSSTLLVPYSVSLLPQCCLKPITLMGKAFGWPLMMDCLVLDFFHPRYYFDC